MRHGAGCVPLLVTELTEKSSVQARRDQQAVESADFRWQWPPSGCSS